MSVPMGVPGPTLVKRSLFSMLSMADTSSDLTWQLGMTLWRASVDILCMVARLPDESQMGIRIRRPGSHCPVAILPGYLQFPATNVMLARHHLYGALG